MTPISAPSPIAAPAKRDPELRKAAEAFEAVILRQMLATMRQAKLGNDIFGSSATDNFREMADARLADSMASLRQFGIADLVERQLGAKA
jgi:peptidoglycan hydrolase FlgJ